MNLEDVKKFNLLNINKVPSGVSNNPITIQEKLRWLNIYDIPWNESYNMPLKSVCADKLLVKQYLKDMLGTDICIPTLDVYNSVDEINWDNLPNEFVMKCNHGSGMNIICFDKSKLNINNCIKKLKYWINDDFTFRNGFESHYHWIDRKIFVEKLLLDKNQKDSLFDYKFWCFNGEPKLYTINNGHGHGDIMYYKIDDTEYNLYGVKNNILYKKPENFLQMVDYAKKISAMFKFVRVDFYEVNGKVYLGELTFTPGANNFKYKLSEDNIKVGNLLDIQHTTY